MASIPTPPRSEVPTLLPGMGTVLQPGDLVPGLQPAGQLAQGPWKSKLSQKQIDSSSSPPNSPMGWAWGWQSQNTHACGGSTANLWTGRGQVGGGLGSGEKEPSLLSCRVSPGGYTQAAVTAGPQDHPPLLATLRVRQRQDVPDQGLVKVSVTPTSRAPTRPRPLCAAKMPMGGGGDRISPETGHGT